MQPKWEDEVRQILWLMLTALLLGMIVLALFLPMPAKAHDAAILRCSNNLVVKHVTKLSETINSNGTVSEWYDRNGDGKPDIEAISSILKQIVISVRHQEHPIFWVVDIDFDGLPDKVFTDIHGEGRCDDIVLYRDLLRGAEMEEYHGSPPSERREGRT
jgi:hypothetical protein